MTLDDRLSSVAKWFIVVSAIVQALDAALAGRQNILAAMPFMSAEWYQYVPLALVGSAGLIWVFRQLIPERKKKPPFWTEEMTPVIGMHFYSCEVEIDGKHFHKCVFDGVTLVFRGTAMFQFASDCVYKGRVSTLSKSRAATMYVNLLEYMGTIPGMKGLRLSGVDPKTGEIRPRVFAGEVPDAEKPQPKDTKKD